MNPLPRTSLLVLAAVALSLSITSANATLTGATVDVSANFPTSSAVFADGGLKVVSNAVEYPAGSFLAYNPTISVDVAATSFTIQQSTGTSFLTASFNGFVLSLISGAVLTSASVDLSSTLTPVSVSLTGGNRIEVNFSGRSPTAPWMTIINVTSTNGPAGVPESSSTFALLGSVMLGFVLIQTFKRTRCSVPSA